MNKNGINWECLSHIGLGAKLHSCGDLRFVKTGAQKPHASADVRGQDYVDCELYDSHFSNIVV